MYSDAMLSLISRLSTVHVAFMLLSGLLVYVLIQVQKREDFDFAEMLKTNGKPSAARLGMIVSLFISSFVVVQVAVAELSNNSPSSRLTDVLGLYLGVFAGAKVLEKGIDAWRGGQRSNTRTDRQRTRQPDFEDTTPLDMDEIVGHRRDV